MAPGIAVVVRNRVLMPWEKRGTMSGDQAGRRRAKNDALAMDLSAFVRANKKTEDVCRTLAEVFELLEEYGPAWYSSKLRKKIVRALKRSAGSGKKKIRQSRRVSDLRKR